MQITNNFGEGVTSMMANGMPLSALLPANPLVAVCVSAGLGILFPVCECAVVPVVRVSAEVLAKS